MRGTDQQQNHVFSYISPEQRVRKDHPLRPIRTMVDEIPKQLSPQFSKMYAKACRPSIPPEQLLRAQLLQMFYSVRSERLLMEEMDYNTAVVITIRVCRSVLLPQQLAGRVFVPLQLLVRPELRSP